jgi:hypothetical protein
MMQQSANTLDRNAIQQGVITDLQVGNGVSLRLFIQWVIDKDVQRPGGTTKPSEGADPTSPYEPVGNRQRTMLITDTNAATQDRHSQCHCEQQRLHNLYKRLVNA